MKNNYKVQQWKFWNAVNWKRRSKIKICVYLFLVDIAQFLLTLNVQSFVALFTQFFRHISHKIWLKKVIEGKFYDNDILTVGFAFFSLKIFWECQMPVKTLDDTLHTHKINSILHNFKSFSWNEYLHSYSHNEIKFSGNL